jgi:hypothetical protein
VAVTPPQVPSSPSPAPTGIRPTPDPSTLTPPLGGQPTPFPPAGGAQPQSVIRRSLGAKTGVNLLGELETWALPDAQRVTQAVLTLSGVSVKELRDLCVKLPSKLKAELQVNLPPEGGSAQ